MQLRDLFDEFPLPKGEVVPIALQQLLRSELDVHQDWARTERLLLDTRTLIPERLEPVVALYKMYAYSNRHAEALGLIHEALERAASSAGFDPDWHKLSPQSAPWSPASGAIRLYLYSLKALGFVLLRSGEVAEAHAALTRLAELDPQDQVGGSVVLGMAERLLAEE